MRHLQVMVSEVIYITNIYDKKTANIVSKTPSCEQNILMSSAKIEDVDKNDHHKVK